MALAQQLSPVFNVMAVVATAFVWRRHSAAGASQINSGLNTVSGLPVSVFWQAVIIWWSRRCFDFSGHGRASRGEMVVAGQFAAGGFLALLVFVFGPTVAIIDT